MKNKILSFVLALCLIIPCAVMFTGCKDKETKATIDAWDGTVAEVSAADNNNVIIIETAEELAGLAKSVNEGTDYDGITVKLARDLDLQNKEWTPIGYGSNSGDETVDAHSAAFKGNFDGQDHTIYNLKITTFVGGSANAESATGIGLFGNIHGSTIKDLDIENAVVTGNHWVGAAVGFARACVINDVDVDNATITCTYLDKDEDGGKAGVVIGFIGNSIEKNSSVTDCEADDSTVSAARDAGQVIGCQSTDPYPGSTTTTTQSNNKAENVVVTDNNSNNDNVNDNIKNEVVGRVNG